MMTFRILTTMCGLYAAIVLSGCSIGMALSGNKQPNFDLISVGAPRNQVEAEFGHPSAMNELTAGIQEATYKYEMGNSPNTGRAWMYGYAWLTIIGILGEPIYSLIELNMGHDEETRIVYGPDNRVLEIHGYTPPPVSKVVIESESSQEKFIERRQKSQSTPVEQSGSPPAQ
ncbi:MAG: hypothetical protein CAF45_015520 [Nitrospira sp. CG24E]|nr:MAG: hypothetical protein CAF45_015520 [Nitrospira sp. CG24E]